MGRFGDRRAKNKRPGSGLPPMSYRMSNVIRRVSTRGPISVRPLESRPTRHGYSRATGVRASSPWTSWRIFHGSAIPQRQGGNLALRRLAERGWLRQIVPVRVFEPAGQNVPQMIGQIVDSHSKAVNIQGLKTSTHLACLLLATEAGSGTGWPLTGSIVGAYGVARRQGH